MIEFNKSTLNKLKKLCRIECTEEEEEKLLNNLQSILTHIEKLDHVDTEGVQECYTVLENVSNLMREDEVGDIMPKEDLLTNAPSHIGGMIKVPPVLKFLD